jgi:hypothetical protein
MKALARSSPLAFALVIALVATPSAQAKDEEAEKAPATAALRYAKTYLAAMTEARDRGCVVFLTFHGDG